MPTLPPGFRIQRETNTEEFFINMGPQHPSTHGALRLALRMDGETIVELVPHFGYIHRGMEKQAESMSYLQYIALSDRQDYLTAIQNNLGVVIALEKGMNVGVPEKGEYIRVMLQELGRIASHLVFFGCFGGDLGGQTCLLFGFKEREMIHDILEEVTGSRLTTNFFRPGGSRYDVPETFIPRVKAFLDHLEDSMRDYERFLSKNIIVLERSIGIGVLSKEDAIAYGCSGPVLRASGVNFDVRRVNPYSIYDQLQDTHCRDSRIHEDSAAVCREVPEGRALAQQGKAGATPRRPLLQRNRDGEGPVCHIRGGGNDRREALPYPHARAKLPAHCCTQQDGTRPQDFGPRDHHGHPRPRHPGN